MICNSRFWRNCELRQGVTDFSPWIACLAAPFLSRQSPLSQQQQPERQPQMNHFQSHAQRSSWSLPIGHPCRLFIPQYCVKTTHNADSLAIVILPSRASKVGGMDISPMCPNNHLLISCCWLRGQASIFSNFQSRIQTENEDTLTLQSCGDQCFAFCIQHSNSNTKIAISTMVYRT